MQCVSFFIAFLFIIYLEGKHNTGIFAPEFTNLKLGVLFISLTFSYILNCKFKGTGYQGSVCKTAASVSFANIFKILIYMLL